MTESPETAMDAICEKMHKTAHDLIEDAVHEHLNIFEQFFVEYEGNIFRLAERIARSMLGGNKILFAGNGGSACDAMHIAGEFVGRFQRERTGLPAISLSADSGIITAIANDFGFDAVFARQVQALGQAGDLLIAMSTSGSSPNILAAIEQAREQGLTTVLLTGSKGRDLMTSLQTMAVDSTNTARIQEVHIAALHILADITESLLADPEMVEALLAEETS